MIENILGEFKNGLKTNTWLDEETRKYALEKANNMDYRIGYSSHLNDKFFSQKFKKVVDILNIFIV
jgi:predicted metalloendopeptidase